MLRVYNSIITVGNILEMSSEDHTTRRRRKGQLLVSKGDDIDQSNVENPTDYVSKKQTSRKRKKHNRREDPPFIVLVCQVGTVLFLVCVSIVYVYRYFIPIHAIENEVSVDDDNNSGGTRRSENLLNARESVDYEEKVFLTVDRPKAPTSAPTSTPMPYFNLTEMTKYDAFGLMERYIDTETNQPFWKAATGLIEQFTDLYGGENAARGILQNGFSTFNRDDYNGNKNLPSSLLHTACRIQQAKTEQRPFVFAFGGYSVTTGRGNYFSQSFPIVMEKQLHTVFTLLNITLKVTNAAIGGCPSFPYGWCMSAFWPRHTDVVSWDYSMNEAGGDPIGLEAYIRHVLQLPRQPKLLVKDTYMAKERRNILQNYVDLNFMHDPLVLHSEPAIRPFLDLPSDQVRPPGFVQWRKFGAPQGAPGQALHHPAVAEHVFLAWLYTMHFLSALQVVAAADEGKETLSCPYLVSVDSKEIVTLPPPIYFNVSQPSKPWQSIMWGEPTSTDNETWRMNPVHCRTTFEPISAASTPADLSEIVVSGTTGEFLDVMLPKSKMYYNRAWVLDLSDEEKNAKRQLSLYGGLGFVDSKKAYYGLFQSHKMRLLLPYMTEDNDNNIPAKGDLATQWFKSVVLCQVNEKREAYGACKLEFDLQFALGGINVTSTMIDAAGSLYLGRRLCIYLPVPQKATLTTRDDILKAEKSGLVLPDRDDDKNHKVGLLVDTYVTNFHIVKREQACSISHVVWEQHLIPKQKNSTLIATKRR